MPQSDPAIYHRVKEKFESAAFVRHLGIALVGAGEGWIETEMIPRPEHTQAEGFVHAGVVTTLADHSAGAAARTLAATGHTILSVEFKVNLLRPALGERLSCRADVLRPGRRITVVEAKVHAHKGETSKLVAAGLFTMALVAEHPKRS